MVARSYWVPGTAWWWWTRTGRTTGVRSSCGSWAAEGTRAAGSEPQPILPPWPRRALDTREDALPGLARAHTVAPGRGGVAPRRRPAHRAGGDRRAAARRSGRR